MFIQFSDPTRVWKVMFLTSVVDLHARDKIKQHTTIIITNNNNFIYFIETFSIEPHLKLRRLNVRKKFFQKSHMLRRFMEDDHDCYY